MKFSEVCGLDANPRQFAEAGIDSVDRFATGEYALDCRGARGYADWLEGSTAIGSPRQIARQSSSEASPGRIMTVIVLSRRGHAAG